MSTPGDAEPAVAVDADGTLRLGPRAIPVPRSVSPAAQAMLAVRGGRLPPPPPLDDHAAWEAHIAVANAALQPRVQEMFAAIGERARVETRTIAGVTVHIGIPAAIRPGREGWLRLVVHGGALVYLAGDFARADAAIAALQSGCIAWSVDYRMPPAHPYPAALDDVVAVYRAALADFAPGQVAISGVSAGGNLAPAAVLKARDLGLPLPGAVVLDTPECDLTESGDSFVVLREIDGVLPAPLPAEIALYAAGADLSHPYLSPLFGDFTQGFPPTFVKTGTRDLFLSNSVRMHRALRRAGIDAELHVWEAAPHGGFGPDAPETADALAELDRFLESRLNASKGASA